MITIQKILVRGGKRMGEKKIYFGRETKKKMQHMGVSSIDKSVKCIEETTDKRHATYRLQGQNETIGNCLKAQLAKRVKAVGYVKPHSDLHYIDVSMELKKRQDAKIELQMAISELLHTVESLAQSLDLT